MALCCACAVPSSFREQPVLLKLWRRLPQSAEKLDHTAAAEVKFIIHCHLCSVLLKVITVFLSPLLLEQTNGFKQQETFQLPTTDFCGWEGTAAIRCRSKFQGQTAPGTPNPTGKLAPLTTKIQIGILIGQRQKLTRQTRKLPGN